MKGLKALEAFKQKQTPLHYVVIDVRLPDIDGIKLLKVIKFTYPELPVVVITGYGTETMAADAKSEKADAYLEKPFTVDELTKIFAEIPEKAAAAAVAEKESAEPGEKKAVSAYVLLNFSESADLSEVVPGNVFHGPRAVLRRHQG